MSPAADVWISRIVIPAGMEGIDFYCHTWISCEVSESLLELESSINLFL
jgi:hypothetical protein